MTELQLIGKFSALTEWAPSVLVRKNALTTPGAQAVEAVLPQSWTR
jgi:hypothetical protein